VAEVDYFMSLVAFVDIVIPILLIVLMIRAMVILRRRSDQLDALERRITELENRSRQGSGS
jgi:septation ring formation regulator EzrA